MDKADKDADAGEAEAPGTQNKRWFMNKKTTFNPCKTEDTPGRKRKREPGETEDEDGTTTKAKFKRSNVFRTTLQNIKWWGERLIKGRKRKVDEESSDTSAEGTARAKEDVQQKRR